MVVDVQIKKELVVLKDQVLHMLHCLVLVMVQMMAIGMVMVMVKDTLGQIVDPVEVELVVVVWMAAVLRLIHQVQVVLV